MVFSHEKENNINNNNNMTLVFIVLLYNEVKIVFFLYTFSNRRNGILENNFNFKFLYDNKFVLNDILCMQLSIFPIVILSEIITTAEINKNCYKLETS